MGMTEYVYFIQAGQYIKVGRAKDVMSRLDQLKAGSPFPLTLLGAIPGSRKREIQIHEKFKHLRAHGEWFSRCPEIENYIRDTLQAEGIAIARSASAPKSVNFRLTPMQVWQLSVLARIHGSKTQALVAAIGHLHKQSFDAAPDATAPPSE